MFMGYTIQQAAKAGYTIEIRTWSEAIEQAKHDYAAALMEARAVSFVTEAGYKRQRYTILSVHQRLLRDSEGEIVLILDIDGLGMRAKGELPETLICQLPGRPTRDLVLHPGLDPEAIIVSAEAREGMVKIEFDRPANVEIDEDDE